MKKLGKKLRLDRETVLRLDPRELDKVRGGIDWTGCDSACTQCGAQANRGVLIGD